MNKTLICAALVVLGSAFFGASGVMAQDKPVKQKWRFAQEKYQVGIASWYGTGRKTASGEAFKPNDLTCAHRVAAFGTMFKVTHLKNKKTVVCRVNDRGPFVAGRIIDLSRGAARQIDMISAGLAKVKIEKQ